jgi:hypothetical protein
MIAMKAISFAVWQSRKSRASMGIPRSQRKFTLVFPSNFSQKISAHGQNNTPLCSMMQFYQSVKTTRKHSLYGTYLVKYSGPLPPFQIFCYDCSIVCTNPKGFVVIAVFILKLRGTAKKELVLPKRKQARLQQV